MRYTVRKSFIDVVGKIWMPSAICSMRYDVPNQDMPSRVNGIGSCGDLRDDEGKVTRESVEEWLSSNSGDFASIVDFSASIEVGDETVTIPFASEDGEMAWLDTLATAEEV